MPARPTPNWQIREIQHLYTVYTNDRPKHEHLYVAFYTDVLQVSTTPWHQDLDLIEVLRILNERDG